MTKLILNALLAALWAGLATLLAGQEVSKVALVAAGTAALRALIGALAVKLDRPIPVDV